MAQGRGSAAGTMAAAVAILCLVLHFEYAHAVTYTVGGTGGWTFIIANWPKGKRFRTGDTLLFDYDSTSHNVVSVNRAGYTSCRAPRGAKMYRSGKDQVKLAKGLNFFICTFPGHCQAGMKIAINAV